MADPTTSDTPSSDGPQGGPPSGDDGPGYAEALAELEAILASLERADLDVDVLGERVARAAELIRRCRARIGAARLQVEQVVSELDE
jgi:exodeoxyribonuclease VII small subunit